MRAKFFREEYNKQKNIKYKIFKVLWYFKYLLCLKDGSKRKGLESTP